MLFVHYNDLLADLEGEMRRVAEFCGIEVPDDAWPAVVQRCHIDAMREDARKAQRHDLFFVGGADAFFYKGSNGRWRDVLTGEQLERYQRRIAEVLTPEQATWLEYGRLGAPTA